MKLYNELPHHAQDNNRQYDSLLDISTTLKMLDLKIGITNRSLSASRSVPVDKLRLNKKGRLATSSEGQHLRTLEVTPSGLPPLSTASMGTARHSDLTKRVLRCKFQLEFLPTTICVF